MKKSVRTASLGATAVVAGLIMAFGAAGAASAADSEISGEGHVTLNFASTPGSVDVEVYTHNLSSVEAWGAAIVRDINGDEYPFGPSRYAPDEEKTFVASLPGYTCADLGRGAVAFAYGFGSLSQPEPDWIGAPLSYPDARITVIGCTADPDPSGGDPDPDPETPPVVTPVGGSTTPTGTNTLPAARTDGAELAGSTSSPLFGFAVTLGAILAVAVGSTVTGALKRR